jgi:hypothetical protein
MEKDVYVPNRHRDDQDPKIAFSSKWGLYNLISFLRKWSNDGMHLNPDVYKSMLETRFKELAICLDTALSNFKKNNKIKPIDVQQFSTALISVIKETARINERLFVGHDPSTANKNVIQYNELMLNFAQNLSECLDVRKEKAKIKATINDFRINLLTQLIEENVFYNGNFQRAETYCDMQFILLNQGIDTLKKKMCRYKNRLHHVDIYFYFGYPEVALSFLPKIAEILLAQFNSIYTPALNNLIRIYQKTSTFYIDKDIFQALVICYHALSFIEKFLEKYRKIYTSELEVAEEKHQCFKDILHSVVNFYLEDFKEKIEGTEFEKLIAEVKFDLSNEHISDPSIRLTLKKIEHISHIKHAFNLNGIDVKVTTQEQLQVNLLQCPLSLLEKVFNTTPKLIAQTAEELKQREAFKREKECMQSEKVNSGKSPTLQIPSQFDSPSSFFNVESLPQTHKKKKRKKPIQEEKGFNISMESKKNPMLANPPEESIICKWEKSGLNYKSGKKHGVVKMIKSSSSSIPDGIWFGYIPEAILKNEHYHPGFSDRLNRGAIGKNGIRNIAKELHTRGWQDTDTEYRFKIVIPSCDYRLYGFIDDICIDPKGRKRFLVCFGVLGNHKLKHLPDPESIKKRWDNLSKKMPREQSFMKNWTNNYIASFNDIIYQNTSNISKGMLKALSKFLDSLYDWYKIFDQKESPSEDTSLLLSSLEEIKAQVKILTNEKLGSPKQLEVLNTIIFLLSKLKSEENYAPIHAFVKPLLHAMINIRAFNYGDTPESRGSLMPT